MADPQDNEQTEEESEIVEVEEESTSAPVIFLLKSVVRGRANRTARAAQPGRMSFVQNFAGGRIKVRRARPARITEAALIANIEEIKRAVASHKVVVTTLSGRVLDMETLNAAPVPAEKPLPNPPLDSAKNDTNQNIGYDVPPTPEGTTADAPIPELLKGTQDQEPELPPQAVVEVVTPEPETVPAADLEVPKQPDAEPELTGVETPVTPEVVETPELETQAKPHDAPKHHKGKGKRG